MIVAVCIKGLFVGRLSTDTEGDEQIGRESPLDVTFTESCCSEIPDVRRIESASPTGLCFQSLHFRLS